MTRVDVRFNFYTDRTSRHFSRNALVVCTQLSVYNTGFYSHNKTSTEQILFEC